MISYTSENKTNQKVKASFERFKIIFNLNSLVLEGSRFFYQFHTVFDGVNFLVFWVQGQMALHQVTQACLKLRYTNEVVLHDAVHLFCLVSALDSLHKACLVQFTLNLLGVQLS